MGKSAGRAAEHGRSVGPLAAGSARAADCGDDLLSSGRAGGESFQMRRVCILLALLAAAGASARELRFCLRADPKTFNPLEVSEEPDEIIRYLTGGVLIRMNRLTQQLEGELAESWKVSATGRVDFKLRPGVRFSDGAPLTADDVVFTLRTLLDPASHSPAGDPFRVGKGTVTVSALGGSKVAVVFPTPIAGVERLFDQVVISSARALEKSARPAEMPVLGPYRVTEYRAGSYVLLGRNPFYWKKDEKGRQLPYIDAVRLPIQQNRDLELLRFIGGDLDLINKMDVDSFNRLAVRRPAAARNAGRSLESEQM